MAKPWQITFFVLLVSLWMSYGSIVAEEPNKLSEQDNKTEELLKELKSCKFKIIHETYRDNNWELVVRDADGSNPVNITNTPDIDELYPHVSPDAKKVVFVADERKEQELVRNVYLMDIDGAGRVRVAENCRQPFWEPNSKIIGFLGGGRLSYAEPWLAWPRREDLRPKTLYIYNVETKRYFRHPRKDISGLLNPSWSSNGKWIVSSVAGGMGFGYSIIAIKANGTKVIELERSQRNGGDIWQCRPDISHDGKRIAWGKEDDGDYMCVEVSEIDLDSSEPEVSNPRCVVTVSWPLEIYHVDWSPDSKFIAYAQGKKGSRMARAPYVIGNKATGWDIWVVSPSKPGVAVRITQDGLSNKEPDWILVRK